MIKHFLSLEWKQYFRSSYWQKNMVLNILLVFFALYMIGIFVFLGAFLFKILSKVFPEQDPFIVVNSFLFYWIIGDLLLRFFMQKLPVMSVKPLLTLPVKRSTIVNFVLGKAALNFFNFLPLFALIPFCFSLLNNGYSGSVVFTWLATLIIITYCLNFLNFIIEAFTAERDYSFLPLIVGLGGLFALNYFEIISFTELVGNGILAITENPVFILVPIGILIALYTFNFKILKDKLFLDASLKTKVKEVNASDLAWTNRFGDVAPFMKLDLRLIWRNKRTKSMSFLMIIGLFYGLIIYPQPVYENIILYAASFVGVFSTGIFLISFGQFIPAWDSGYYKMLMSQNIKYEQYLRSKFILMASSVVVMFILGIPYIYFGWEVLLVHFATAIYNIGINSHIMLFGGSFNRKKIDLDKKAAFNYQGTGAVQWIIGLPIMIIPLIFFSLLNAFINFEVAVATLMIAGIIGIVLHKKLMLFITEKYLNSKHKMIAAFSKDA